LFSIDIHSFTFIQMMKPFVLFALVSMILSTACTNDNLEDLTNRNSCDSTNVSFATTVVPLINTHCGSSSNSCHGAGNTGSGIDLTIYAGVAAVAQSGQLVGSITHASGFEAMPDGLPKLGDCEIGKIRAWVNAGYLNN
jgi:hypothetical protein